MLLQRKYNVIPKELVKMLNEKIKVLIEAVAYLRISRDDGDDESSSITNQRAMISEWAEKNGFIIVDWYIDENYSGYSFKRPDMIRLRDDINNNKVDVVIVKDLSRLGRHNARVNLFLENMEELGKRVIAIKDNYDTTDKSSTAYVGIKTWMNENYVRETSEKVRDAIAKMQEEGRFINNVPYGYYLDPFNAGKYYVDETSCMYVQEIFDMYLNGKGVRAITKEFNKRGVPTPSRATKLRYERMGRTYKRGDTNIWYERVVHDILKNDFYIGILTLRKSRRRSINGRQIPMDREDMIIFENAHEPLIDKRTFYLTQQVLEERRTNNYRGQKRPLNKNTYSGKLFCADCGKRLTVTTSRKNQRYVCISYHLQGTDVCTSHAIQGAVIDENIIYFLKHCRANLSEAIKDLDITLKAKTIDSADGIDSLEQTLKKIEKQLEVLIEQKMTEVINNPSMKDVIERTYENMIRNKYSEIQTLTTQINDFKNKFLNSNDTRKDLNDVLKIFDDIIESKELTKRQIETIVDKMIVHEDGGIDIFLKGDLHELCTNYIQYKRARTTKLAHDFVEYCKDHQDKIIVHNAEIYVRSCGNKIGGRNFSKFFHSLVDKGYLEPIGGSKSGYRVVDISKLVEEVQNDNVMYNTPRLQYNIVTIELINKICTWIRSTRPFKRLF